MARKPKKNPLYDPTVLLSGKNLRKAVNSLVRMQTKPAVNELKRQQLNEQRRADMVMGNARSYMDQLAQRQAALMGAAKDAAARGTEAQAAIGQRTQDALGAAGGQAQARLAQDAELRGSIATMGDTQRDVAQRFAEQMAGSANRAGADAARAAGENSAAERFAIGQAMASGQAGGEQMTQLGDRFAQTFRDLADKRAELTGKKADLRSSLLTDLRQKQFDNAITMRGLNIRQEDIANDFAAALKRVKETRRHNRKMEADAKRRGDLTQRGQNITISENAARRAERERERQAEAGDSGLTPAQRERRRQASIDFWERVNDGAQNIVPQLRDAVFNASKEAKEKGEDPLPWNDQVVRAALRKQGFKPYEIDTVLALLPSHGGKLSPQLVKRLERKHIRVNDRKRARPRDAGPAFDLGSTLGSIFGGLFG